MKLLKRFSLFEILLVATIFGIHLYAATADAYNFPNTWFIRDGHFDDHEMKGRWAYLRSVPSKSFGGR